MASRKAYGPLVSKQSSKVDKETSNFIQYYCKKWRAKTIFQVLLQYRAARFQDLFNLSQQIHLFNQSVVNDIQKINYEVDFDCIDSRAQVSGWLGRRKPSVLKMPFRLEDIPFFDTVYLCDPSQRPTGPRELDEPWDAPLRRKNNVSSQIINSSHGYSLSGAGYDENQRIRKPSVDKIIFIPYNRNPEEPIRRLSNFQLDNDHPIHYGEYQGNNYLNQNPNRSQYSHDDHQRHSYNHTPVNKSYSRNSGYQGYNNQSNENSCNSPKKMRNNYASTSNDYNNRNTTNNMNANTKPANHDFEYIKPPTKSYNQSPPKPVQNFTDSNPIDELQTKFKRTASADEDDPPFNFKAMLRKTNYNRDSIKNREGNSRRYSFKNRDSRNFASVDETNSYCSRNESLRKHRSADEMDAISTELAPGIVVKGYVADL